MMLSVQQIGAMSAEVDRQLAAVRVMPIEDQRDGMDEVRRLRSQLRVQKEAIAVATGEEAEGFLRKFARASRRDLCEEGGVLYEQWKKYADLENEKTIGFVSGIVGAMGLTGGAATGAAIAVTVIMLHLGVKTICEEYGGE
jgi:hypothetical protein